MSGEKIIRKIIKNHLCFENGYCFFINIWLNTPIDTYDLYEDEWLTEIFSERFKERVDFDFEVNEVINLCCDLFESKEEINKRWFIELDVPHTSFCKAEEYFEDLDDFEPFLIDFIEKGRVK